MACTDEETGKGKDKATDPPSGENDSSTKAKGLWRDWYADEQEKYTLAGEGSDAGSGKRSNHDPVPGTDDDFDLHRSDPCDQSMEAIVISDESGSEPTTLSEDGNDNRGALAGAATVKEPAGDSSKDL